ncbi:MAG: hypothetical protein D6776_09080 [Planctomycetota bacterium]|nr:MAG: hypothetical protein D6776_09080 [Planctomycetota bacterium]
MRRIGRIARVLDGPEPGFELRAARGRIAVLRSSETRIVEHRVQRMDRIEAGRPIHVLARHQEEQFDPNSQRTIPEAITNVIAVVVGEGFEPPALTERQRKSRLQWFSGTLHLEAGGHLRKLDELPLRVGPARPVLVLVPAQPAALRRGKTVLVEGRWSGKGQRALQARRIAVLTKGLAAKEYAAILGTAR